MKTIECEKLPHIDGLILEYEQSETMIRALLRISEYYTRNDCKKFFLVEDYAVEHGYEAVETLYKDVHGIMVMNYYIDSLLSDFGWENLYDEERELIQLLKTKGWMNNKNISTKPFYIISVNPEADKSDGIIQHEISHVAYRTSPEYREKVKEAYYALDYDSRRIVLYELMKRRGYSRELVYNEFQAHLFHGFDEDHKRWVDAEGIIDSLEELFSIRGAA